LLFNSLIFVLFFAAVLALHWTLPHRWRNALLLVASYTFYAAWDWRFLALIWFSTTLDYVVGRVISSSDAPRVRRAALLTSLVGNISLLGFFKYYGFFVDSLDALIRPFGASVAELRLDLVLPVGISFYTFQTMSYAIDVYRGRMKAVRNPMNFALYVCFFPQLVAGPIERARNLIPQIERKRRIGAVDLHEGFALALWGMFKKVVVADNLARVVDPVYAQGAQPGGAEVALATVAFAFQVYADFSAYSDIARGTARLLGVRLTRNFELPYFARDMAEIWRRWHISLTTWLRDYVYIPLGGNRRGEVRTSLNLFVTLLLAGLWHGSDGTFVVFGALQGILVVLARQWRKIRPVAPEEALGWAAILNFPVWCAALVLFRAETVAQSVDLYGALLSPWSWGAGLTADLSRTVLCASLLLLFDALWLRSKCELFVLRFPLALRVGTYLAVFYGILLFGRWDALEFVYFQF
jgi:D-alanyl-lipoteichoic acid acyltransferase DltB (MBOAT superfamily)